MEVKMEIKFLHRAKSHTKHHSNPYIESTTVLSDIYIIYIYIYIFIANHVTYSQSRTWKVVM